jgi:hypothetical protein
LTETNERAEGIERIGAGEDAPKEPIQPESSAPPRADAGMAPEGVGESINRHGEDVVKIEGKEAGRQDDDTKGQSDRPQGSSTERDHTGI